MGKDGPGRVHVAAFGKHPGWDDHIEEIGLDHDDLVRAKRDLYSEGMAGNIDSGAWERLADDQRLPAFRHQFYWRKGSGLIIGRIWSSRDGKGRTKYPMVVCAMVEGVPDAWAVREILPRLEAIETKCAGTSSAEMVRMAIGEARRGLEDQVALLAGAGGGPSAQEQAALIKSLVTHPDLDAPGEKGQGLTRVLYEVEREMAQYRPVSVAKRTTSRLVSESGAQHIRVPKCLTGPGEAARAWLMLLAQELADSAPILIIEPLGERFVDVIVGEPKPPQFFCVRAGEKGLALTSDVPYTIEPTFRAEALRKATAWASGQIRIPGVGAAPSASGEASKSTSSGGSMSPRTMAIAGGVGVVVLGVILYMVFGGSKPANNQGPGPTPGATGPKSPDAPSAASATPPKTSTPAPKGPAETPKTPVTQATKPPVVPGPTPIPAEGDPRTGWGLDARLEVVGQLVDRLDRERVAGGLKPLDYGFQPRLNRAKERAEKFVKTRPYSAGQRDAIVGDMSSIDAEVQGVAQEAATELTKVLAGVESFLKNEAKQPQTATGVMKQAWERGMGAIDPQLGWEHARARHAALAKDLKDAEVAVMGASQLSLPALADVNPPALQGAADARRDAALQSAADAVLAGDGTKVKDAASVYASWGNLAKGLLDQARTLDQMMAEGQVVGDPGAAGYGALADQMEQSPAWRDLGAPLASLTARAKALEAMRGEKDPAALLNTLSSARSDMAKNRLAEAMNAWAALGAMGQWPGDDAGMTKAQQAWTNDVKPVIARAPEARRAALTARAQRAADAMWLSFAARRAVDAKGVAAASDAAAAMGVAPATVQQAPEWVRYNLARGALEKAAMAAEPLAPAAKGEALRQAMSAFVASTSGLSVAKQGPGAALGAALAPLMDKGGELDLSKLGPGAVGWTMAGAAEDHVTYELTGPGGTSRVEFRRTEGGGEGVSFISTTEMSVGAFIDIITTAGRGEDLRGWLPKSDAGGVDPRQGPRTWVWSGSALAIVKTAGPGDLGKGWVRIKTAMAQREYYPAGVNVEAPGRDHPMQYVSPQAAILAARLAGCRLPSSGEWKAAGGGPSAPGANLRDATWKKVHEHLRQFAASGPEFPGSGIFWPTGVTRRSPLDDAQPATEADDGQVWFVPVTAGEGTFKNLVGNVSEYVFEEPSQLDGLATTREAIEQVLGKGEKLRIIGASALSPADEKPDNAYPVTTTQSREGYSDVGFRLAFSAPRSAAAAGTAQRLKAALDGSGYLPGAK